MPAPRPLQNAAKCSDRPKRTLKGRRPRLKRRVRRTLLDSPLVSQTHLSCARARAAKAGLSLGRKAAPDVVAELAASAAAPAAGADAAGASPKGKKAGDTAAPAAGADAAAKPAAAAAEEEEVPIEPPKDLSQMSERERKLYELRVRMVSTDTRPWSPPDRRGVGSPAPRLHRPRPSRPTGARRPRSTSGSTRRPGQTRSAWRRV